MLKKLIKYLGPNVKSFIDRGTEQYVFRIVKNRVYYAKEKHVKLAMNVSGDKLFQYLLYNFV